MLYCCFPNWVRLIYSADKKIAILCILACLWKKQKQNAVAVINHLVKILLNIVQAGHIRTRAKMYPLPMLLADTVCHLVVPCGETSLHYRMIRERSGLMSGLNDLCTKYTQSFKVHATVNEDSQCWELFQKPMIMSRKV